MRLEGLTIALRPRTPWEATDLGVALVRAQARRIWSAWLLVTVPVLVLVNAACWPFDKFWLAPLVMWWLKPMFDRVPLFVLSRAVFGDVPSLRETLRAQLDWGWRGIAPWLLWRRLHPGRAMLLPVDLLEGLGGAARHERVRVLSRAGGSPNIMLTIIGAHLEAMLALSTVALVLMFVPTEFLSDSAKVMWDRLVEHPPAWARVLLNANAWLATTLIEPIFIGAGFGLYLNRRVQLEGWDIELDFRRIAARLAPALAALLLLAVATFAAPARAADDDNDTPACQAPAPEPEQPVQDEAPLYAPPSYDPDAPQTSASKNARKKYLESLHDVFADNYRDGGADFAATVQHVYDDSDLSPKRKQWVWMPRDSSSATTKAETPAWQKLFGNATGVIAKFSLWIVIGSLLVVILVNHKRWLPWISERLPRAAPAIAPLEVHALATIDALPGDVAAAVRALWQQGKPRAALALLYRAGVGRLVDLLGAPLPPGATESDCLRAARKLRDQPYAALFARIVRCWQAAAYAQRMPALAEVDALLADWHGAHEAPT